MTTPPTGSDPWSQPDPQPQPTDPAPTWTPAGSTGSPQPAAGDPYYSSPSYESTSYEGSSYGAPAQGQQASYGSPAQDPQPSYGSPAQDPQPSYGSPAPYGSAPSASQAPQYQPADASGGFSQAPFAAGGPAAPEPPKSGRGRMWAIIGCAGCGVVAVILVIVLVFVFVLNAGGPDEPTSPGPTASETTPATDETTPATDETTPATDETTPAQTTDETPVASGDRGTRDAPLAAGTPLVVPASETGGTVDVSIGAVNWDATSALTEVNSGLTPAASGNVYIMVTVTYTYHGTGTYDPSWDIFTEFVGASGTEYMWSPVLTPHNVLDVGEISDGQTATWDIPYEISAEDANDGYFHVYEISNYSDDGFYIAAQ